MNALRHHATLLLLMLPLAGSLHAQRERSVAVISSPTEFRQQPFDVLGYDAALDLTKAPSKEMHGVCSARVHWIGDPASAPYYFHLRDLKIDSAFYNGIPVQPLAVEDTLSPTYHYEITPLPSTRQGDTVTVTIYYSGTMGAEPGTQSWGGVFSTDGTLYAMGVGFHNNYISATEHWLPCYDHPSDKATLHLRVTVPTGFAVASNGRLNVEPGDGSTVFDWTHNVPCATYLYTFAVDHYYPVEFGTDSLPMQVWSRAEDSAATRNSFRNLPRMVRTLEGRFGRYPFEKVGYVNTPTGAMEHETMISFPLSLSRSPDTVNSTAAHELSHQWFGDLVSPLDFRHAWLNESFATYCESIWAEELGGYSAYLQSQTNKANSYINQVAASEGVFPLYDFPHQPPSSNYPETIYSKGAVVVGMLRYELGDSIFFDAMRDYLRSFSYGNATTDDLRMVLEEHASRSLKWFFDQWVYGKGWPQLALTTTSALQESGLHRVTVKLQQMQPESYGTFTNLPVELGFRDSKGVFYYRMLKMTEPQQTFTLDSIPDYALIRVNQGPSVRALLKVVSTSGVSAAAPDSGDVKFTVRPNPAADVGAVTVEVKGTTDCTNIQYELFDTSGRRILLGTNDVCQFTIPIANFSSGAYVLRFNYKSTFYDIPVILAH